MNEKKLKLLERNFNLYWSGQNPEISDLRFDELIRELQKENPCHWLATKLGLDVERGLEYRHTQAMLSLQKAYSFKELQSWVEKTARNPEEKYFLQFKFDGIAAKYERGILATRGNGKIGENISRKLNNIELVAGSTRVPILSVQRMDTILGEIVVTDQAFSEINASTRIPYKNSRNFVAGAINSKELLPKKIRLDFVQYSASPTLHFSASDFNETFWEQLKSRIWKQKEYPCDGLVLKLADEKYADSLGYTAHHPLGAIAFKFTGQTVWTTLLDVKWEAGKRKLAPVGIIAPVDITGVTISKVTLHNYQFIRDLDLQIGDSVEIERAGEVIPHIITSKPGQNRQNCVPDVCPHCGSPVAIVGVNLICTNKNCKKGKLKRMYCALQNFEIDGLGEETVQKMLEAHLLTTPADIFRISEKDIESLPGFQQGSASKLFSMIVSKTKQPVENIFAAMNTEGVGKIAYRDICTVLGWKDVCTDWTFEKLEKISGIGCIRARRILQSIQSNKCFLEQIFQFVTPYCSSESEKTVCFTGKMDKSRKFYQQVALQAGYTPVDSVTETLCVLVTTELERVSSKMEKAKKMGVKILSLNDWLTQNSIFL